MNETKEWEFQRDWIEEISLSVETLITDESRDHRETLLDIIQQYLGVLDIYCHFENRQRLKEVKDRFALLTDPARSN